MGYHADIQEALVALLVAALPSSCGVYNGLTLTEVQGVRLGEFVAVFRESITMEPHAEINPSTAVESQLESWEWVLYIKGGGGASDPAAMGVEVDETLETVRAALNAQRLDDTCGPLNLVGEDFFGESGQGVVYAQRWRHSRLSG